jgi:hypothetical protein
VKPKAVLVSLWIAWIAAIFGGGYLDQHGQHVASKLFAGAVVIAVGLVLVLDVWGVSRWAGEFMYRQWQGTRWSPASAGYALGLWRMAGWFSVVVGLLLLTLGVAVPGM